MGKIKVHAGNPLGDLRAEADHNMLDRAFYETADYLSLIESSDKTVVVGRRGAGKSALAYQLGKHWHDVPKTRVVSVSLEEAQVIGVGPLAELFGGTYRLIRAGCALAWRYCLLMEIALGLSPNYKFGKAPGSEILEQRLVDWRKRGPNAVTRLRRSLKAILDQDDAPANQVAELADSLSLPDVESALQSVLDFLDFTCILLVDRLDEGYEPTEAGVGFVDGAVSAAIHMNQRFEFVWPTLFLRDNMFRTIARWNPDYSRNIEGQVLHLHWKEYDLMNMVCNRLRVAFDIPQESTTKVWNHCVDRELAGKAGFRRCLRLTLYRPRDILVLLNEAFHEALRQDREQIMLADVAASAKAISLNRLDDLHKEYSAILPGLDYLTTAFANRTPEVTLRDATALLTPVLSSSAYTSRVQQNFAILANPIDVLRALYGVGFVAGIKAMAA